MRVLCTLSAHSLRSLYVHLFPLHRCFLPPSSAFLCSALIKFLPAVSGTDNSRKPWHTSAAESWRERNYMRGREVRGRGRKHGERLRRWPLDVLLFRDASEFPGLNVCLCFLYASRCDGRGGRKSEMHLTEPIPNILARGYERWCFMCKGWYWVKWKWFLSLFIGQKSLSKVQ